MLCDSSLGWRRRWETDRKKEEEPPERGWEFATCSGNENSRDQEIEGESKVNGEKVGEATDHTDWVKQYEV